MNPFVLSLKTYNLDVQIHKHAAFQLVFSADKTFRSVIGNTEHPEIVGFLIKPHVPHQCSANANTLIIINTEPCSSAGSMIESLFTTGSNCLVFNTKAEIAQSLGLDEEEDITQAVTKKLLNYAYPATDDERVMKVIGYIKTDFSQNLTSRQLADLVFLSPSRLASLFKKKTGSSLSRYLLWVRLREAITLTVSKREVSLTEIGLQSGFYDLPQLNKYMYQMFGVSPRRLRENSELIQVLDK